MKGKSKYPLAACILIGLAIVLPIVVRERYFVTIAVQFLVWVAVAQWWNYLVGNARIFSMGQIIFFGIGGYASAWMCLTFGLSPWVGMVIGGFAGAAFGLVVSLPCLRLRGIYVALFTIAFLIMLQKLFVQQPLEPFTGSTEGLLGIPHFGIGPLEFQAFNRVPYYYLILGITSASFFALSRLINSKWGLAITALGDSETYAKSLGVNPVQTRILIFSIAAFFTGIVGSFYAHYSSVIGAGIFSIEMTIYYFVIMTIGGLGKREGPFLGALVFLVFYQLLAEWGPYRFIVLGVLLVLILTRMPSGLSTIVESAKVALMRIIQSCLHKLMRP